MRICPAGHRGFGHIISGHLPDSSGQVTIARLGRPESWRPCPPAGPGPPCAHDEEDGEDDEEDGEDGEDGDDDGRPACGQAKAATGVSDKRQTTNVARAGQSCRAIWIDPW